MAHVHYILVENSEARKDAPTVVWQQGGPGGSSLIGLFTENGPLTLNDASFHTAGRFELSLGSLDSFLARLLSYYYPGHPQRTIGREFPPCLPTHIHGTFHQPICYMWSTLLPLASRSAPAWR